MTLSIVRPRLLCPRPTIPSAWPLSLSDAAAQFPDWGGSFAADMRAAAAGDLLTAPITNARILKVTSTGTHGGGDGNGEYGAGGPAFSLPWGSNGDTLSMSYIQGSSAFYCDVDRSLLGISNPILNRRACPGALSTIACGFSRNPNTPRDFFWIPQNTAAVIRRRNTAGTTDTTVKDLTSIAGGAFHQWFDVSADERDFVFISQANGYVIHYDATLDVGTKKVLADFSGTTSIDEIHLVKEGGYAVVFLNPSPNAWLWNLRTHTLTNISSLSTGGAVWTHVDSVGGYVIAQPERGRTIDVAAQIGTYRYSIDEVTQQGQPQAAFHITGQPRQTGTLGERWWGVSHTGNGRVLNYNNLSWVHDSGTIGVDAIYRVVPSYASGSGQSASDMAAKGKVMQYVTGAPGDRTLIRGYLTKVAVGSISAAGQFAFNEATNTVYVRPWDNLDLTGTLKNMVAVFCPSAVNEMLAVVRVADGGASQKAVKFWTHHYSHYDTTIDAGGTYYPLPRAALSQDLRAFRLTSNAGKAAGRRDVYVAFPPAGM